MDELNLYSNEDQYVIVKVCGQMYGLPVKHVREMLVLPEVTELPQAPSFMRGIINLRGQVIPLFDLRVRMGLPAVSLEMEELQELMRQREEDHKNWLLELEASIREGREFKLALDPHQCAFGKWRDSFQTNVMALNTALVNFDRPHAKIHAIAEQAFTLKQNEGKARALELMAQTQKGPLHKMIELFAEIRHAISLSFREIALVAEENGRLMALSVDEVETVEGLRHEDADDMSRLESGEGGMVESVARRRSDGKVVFILDTREFFEQTEEITF